MFQIPDKPSLSQEVTAIVVIAVLALLLPERYGVMLLLTALAVAMVSRVSDIAQIVQIITGSVQ